MCEGTQPIRDGGETMRTFVVSTLAILAACADTPAGPDADAAFARGRGVNYVATNWEGSVWSTGSLKASLAANGEFYFDAGGKGRKAAPELCIDLSEDLTIDAPDAYDAFVQQVAADPNSQLDSGNGIIIACSGGYAQSRDHSNGGAELEVGPVAHAGGKFGLTDFNDAYTDADGNTRYWEFRLHWDVEAPSLPHPERGKGICVHREAETTWHVYNDDDVSADPPAGCTAAAAMVDNVMRLTNGAGRT